MNLYVSSHMYMRFRVIIGLRKKLQFLRLEVFTAVTMKSTLFWDIKTQIVPHRRYITSTLQILAS
jgi:hypothetical protein